MGTLKNPVINFPVSGLAAVIATGMLLFFNLNLSRIYIPLHPFTRPEPVIVPFTELTEQVEAEETIDITQKPVPLSKKDPAPVSTNPPVNPAPEPLRNTDKPVDVKVMDIKSNFDFKIPRISEVFDPKQVDQKPRVLRPVTPVYPYNATVSGIEGRVVMRFIVDENGKVVNPEVIKAKPEGVFEEAALAAIVKYKFIPARAGGEKVKCFAVMPIGFKLN